MRHRPRVPSATAAFHLWAVLGMLLLVVVPLDAKTVRIATFNVENGPGRSGTSDYEATKSVLARINADVIGFQEILNNGTTNYIPNWQQIGEELGYSHVRIGTNASGDLRLGYYSRFPFVSTNNLTSVSPASEFTRRPFRAVINVPGAAKPLVVWNMHHKADEPGAPDTNYGNFNNQLRRAVEALRIVQDINAYRSNNPTHDEFVMLGDLNDNIFQTNSQAVEFTQGDYLLYKSNTALLPTSFVVGADIQFPILYRSFPDARYASGGGLQRLDLRQQNGFSAVTRPTSSRTLDYIFVSPAILTNVLGVPRGEVYNSQLDTASTPGLPKAGGPLASGTSLAASDHLAVFADIQMADAEPAPFISTFSPNAGAPGATVVLEGLFLGSVNSVRFGGVEAVFFIESDTRITATVPPGAVSGAIVVSDEIGSGSSPSSFWVTSLPAAPAAETSPSSLTGFAASVGEHSPSQQLGVSASGLPGPLQVVAPAGFEVSTNGADFSSALQISAPTRGDAATNYGAVWAAGSNSGRGFRPWTLLVENSRGTAVAYFGNPADSQVTGMGAKAFALRAEPAGSGAFVDAIRALENPLAVGESLAFDWGINWDSDTALGEKGFAVKSGAFVIASVHQGTFPGPIMLRHGTNEAGTGLAYGTSPMRWSFRQVDAGTLNITATARTGGTNVAYATNIPVPGSVTGFIWSAFQMDSATNRRSYYDNLSIAPSGPGGGALLAAEIFVRLAANAPVGDVGGTLFLSSDGQSLASVALSGTVSARSDYDAWVQGYGLDPAGDGARGADPDGDGQSNLREFLFGGDPRQAEGSLVAVSPEKGALFFTFLTRTNGPTYSLLSTTNLSAGPWESGVFTLTDSADQSSLPAGYLRKQAVATNPPGHLFLRLQGTDSD